MTLNDLHSSESKGRWWLVGAGWAGDPLLEHKAEKKSTLKQSEGKSADERLLQLAKAQGMNTDIRRSIFVILMSSEVWFPLCSMTIPDALIGLL